jgi:hypothetical protein
LGEVFQELKPFANLRGEATFEMKHRAQCLLRDTLAEMTAINEAIVAEYKREIRRKERALAEIKAVTKETQERLETIKSGRTSTSTAAKHRAQEKRKSQVEFEEKFERARKAEAGKWRTIEENSNPEQQTQLIGDFVEEEQRNLLNQLRWRLNRVMQDMESEKVNVTFFKEKIRKALDEINFAAKMAQQKEQYETLQAASA